MTLVCDRLIVNMHVFHNTGNPVLQNTLKQIFIMMDEITNENISISHVDISDQPTNILIKAYNR